MATTTKPDARDTSGNCVPEAVPHGPLNDRCLSPAETPPGEIATSRAST